MLMQRLIFLIISFLLIPAVPAQPLTFGPGAAAPGARLDGIVAVVDDSIITRSELERALAAVQRQIAQTDAKAPPVNVLEQQVLDRLILRQLQKRAAERSGIVIDDQTLNAALEDIARNNKLTLSELRTRVEKEGTSFNDFREEIRQEIAAARLRQREVDSRIQVSDQEVDSFLNRTGTQPNAAGEYRIAQILIALPDGASPEQIEQGRIKAQEVLDQLRDGADFAALAVAVSDGRQALEGGDLGWRRAEQLPTLFAEVVPRLSPGEVSNPIRSPSGFHLVKLLETRGAARQTVTQTHARHILIKTNDALSDEEARQSLLRLRERAVNGENFGELARANSNDTVSAARNGDLGWVAPGTLVPNFEQVMNSLQPGETSEPFQTRFGWHLVQVLERRQQDAANEAQRAAAREALFRRKAEEEWEQWLRRLRDETYVEVRL